MLDIQKVVELIERKQSPFDQDSVPEKLINIISGQVASEEVEKGMVGFLHEGEKINAVFIQEWMT